MLNDVKEMKKYTTFVCGIKNSSYLCTVKQNKETTMIKGYSFNLATRFGSDYKIPIAVYDNVESFEYHNQLLKIIEVDIKNI